MSQQPSILLIISGSIAAYKSLDLIRRLREYSYSVRAILTKGGEQFVTPLSVASLTGTGVYTDLFSLKDEVEMGHIRLAREADIILVAPASADILAKMAAGHAGDLATATLLAADKPVLVAPAMNHRMWEHKATQRNMAQLQADGIQLIAPEAGDLACGETGSGRMAEVETILAAIEARLQRKKKLSGLKVLVTSGSTYEPIDPVRFIGNRSSGKQGHAIAAALAAQGAAVTLVSGNTKLAAIAGVHTVQVETAEEMLAASLNALPVDVAICAAAVADWKPQFPSARKLKKRDNQSAPAITLTENPDILKTLATLKKHRPKLVVGFAAETEKLEANAHEKLARKGCDWILANSVAQGKTFGAEDTSLTFVTKTSSSAWGNMSKSEAAEKLAEAITSHFKGTKYGTDTGRKTPAR